MRRIIIKKKLMERLDSLQISQTELADKIGVTRQVVSLWIHGKSGISLKRINKVCEILSVEKAEISRIIE